MRVIFLAFVILVISLPEYEAGYLQYFKDLLSMQNQDKSIKGIHMYRYLYYA
jgi:hypothetical protein